MRPAGAAPDPAGGLSLEGPSSHSPEARGIAYHEAGHIVVGTLLGLAVLDADTAADGQGGRGHTHFAPPGPWFQPARGELTWAERDFIERVVTTFMAGFAAEARLGTADPEGSGWDLDLALREWLGHLERDPSRRAEVAAGFLARARALLERPEAWAAVERVGAALLRRGRLDGAAARDLVRAG